MHRLLAAVHDALRSLRAFWGATAFAVLTIALSVAAFATVVAIGSGMTLAIGKRFELLGRDTVTLTLTDADMNMAAMPESLLSRLEHDVAGIRTAVPVSELEGRFARASSGRESIVTPAIATTSGYFVLSKATFQQGRGLVTDDDMHATRTCVIGSKVAARLGLASAPIGAYLHIGDASVRVVGVLDETREPGKFVSLDYVVIVSRLTAASLGAASTGIDRIILAPQPGLEPTDFMAALRRSAQSAAPQGMKVRIETRNQLMNASREATARQTLLVSIVAMLSLGVSGLGLMNIAYLAISERFQEIGLRRALGASKVSIRNLFLLESLLVSVAGVTVGLILAGMASGFVASAFGIAALPSFALAQLTLVSLLSVGLTMAFTVLPAMRAAAVDPVLALKAD